MASKPVQTFREGAIGLSIWERRGENGPFFEFTLSRAWKKTDEEAGYARSFNEYHEEALVKVIREAAAFIREAQTSPSEAQAA